MRVTRILISVAAPVLPALAVFLFFNGRKAAEKERTPEVLAFSRIPETPAEFRFAGETVDLKRYDLYERFDRELTGFTYNHSTTLLMIKRANRYFPQIEPILKAEGIPDDFKYLAVIESVLDPRAVSSAGAVGLWQLLKDTGRECGLEVNDSVDERYHLEKATRAACRYFRQAREKYGDWLTVSASYNAGMRRISEELCAQQVTGACDLLLNNETSRYLFRLMALKAVMSHPYRYGFVIRRDQLYKPVRCFGVEVTETVPDLTAFARSYGITYAQLKDFNPWLRGRSLPDKSGKRYALLIPERSDLYYGEEPVPVHDENWIVE